jgi:serine/threonine protein kinase
MDKRPGGNSKLTDYEILTKLGQGSFGIVYRVKRKSNHSLFNQTNFLLL